MALGNYDALKSELKSILTSSGSTGENESPEEAMDRIAGEKATAMADAISAYVDSVVFEVPAMSFVDTVTGQAAGTKNPTPVEVDKT